MTYVYVLCFQASFPSHCRMASDDKARRQNAESSRRIMAERIAYRTVLLQLGVPSIYYRPLVVTFPTIPWLLVYSAYLFNLLSLFHTLFFSSMTPRNTLRRFSSLNFLSVELLELWIQSRKMNLSALSMQLPRKQLSLSLAPTFAMGSWADMRRLSLADRG